MFAHVGLGWKPQHSSSCRGPKISHEISQGYASKDAIVCFVASMLQWTSLVDKDRWLYRQTFAVNDILV